MKKLANGFTLLEMLLVLAVIALVAVMGLSTYQQRVVTFKVEKTALQMQMILEAAKAYNDNTGNWPSTNAQFANYLAGMPLNNCPWYNASTACYVPIPPAGSVAKYQLTVTIPTSQSNYAQIAQMIAAHLPNASVTGASNNIVTAAMPTNTSPTQIQQTVVKVASFSGCANPYAGTGTCPPPGPITLLSCSAGYTRKVYFSLSTYTDMSYDARGYWEGKGGHMMNAYYSVYAKDGQNVPHNPITVPPTTATVTPIFSALDAYNNGFSPIRGVGLAIETCELTPPGESDVVPQENAKEKNPLIEY